ncbi:DUF1638 domain-containing protein [Salipiger bermudensis]|uniref:DUF1638 domain-containing protein n=1 Tax=Salipiger bermudensis TaxID=344736 RepID=UPI001C996C46|nr:DUF1638 domain-containing protein [Salipiger bermudensis]MBY6005973.1 DUF1638 domain-containing protein [Salipiger bermudensis]
MTATPDSTAAPPSPDRTVAPDDATLTTTGFETPGDGRLLIIACGALAREILALRDRHGWHHIELTCLPAILHNHPEKITDAVRAAVLKHRDTHSRIFVAYADCGTGGLLQAACAELGVEMIAGPHCYAFYEGLAPFGARDEITSFYLTDFLVRQFDAFVWQPLGLDRHPELREMYFGHYETLVYQAQTDDPALTARAQSHAARLGLTFERRMTGYGDLETVLSHWAEPG